MRAKSFCHRAMFFGSVFAFSNLAAVPELRADDWYQWRGPNRDGIAEVKGLASKWSEDGPALLYQSEGLGRGMSSLVIGDNKLYTLGELDGKVQLVCCDVANGRVLWKTPFGAAKGAPNGTPTLDLETKRAYAISFDGLLVCCDANSGEILWQRSFQNDFGGKMESVWGYSESPLIDGDRLLCTPGAADAMVVALDKKTGETIWKGPAPKGDLRGNDGAGYSSIVISEGAGIKQYIQLIGHGVVSYDSQSGELLWHYDRVANRTANIPTPIVKDNYVFCSTGYDDGGTALLQMIRRGKKVDIREVYYKTNKELQNHHGGMIMIGEFVYLGHGHNNGFPACIRWKTGENLWGRARGAGSGSAAIVAADRKLFYRYQDGTMAMIAANPRKYELLGSFKLPTHEGESWPHPVVWEGKLFIRDQQFLQCFDLKGK